MHTARQLSQKRIQLKSSLSTIAREALIVAVGYGGWDDILTSTLAELVLDDSSSPDIAWAFYSSSPEDIEAQSNTLLNKLTIGIDRGRVSLYAGVDCNIFFPSLYDRLYPSKSGQVSVAPELTPEQAKLASILDDVKPKSEPINAVPKTDVWFGRVEELDKLATSNSKAIAITGIGGQGKSTLASHFFETEKLERPTDFFDWKDCREQGNTINLALCSAIEKASGSKISINEISRHDVVDLINILLREIGPRAGIIVFDNVDYYIDLETSEPLGALKIVMEEVLNSTSQTIFMFTARPIVRVEHSEFLELRLYGLDRTAAKNLFEYRFGGVLSQDEFQKLYEFTAGHPLWLSIMAAQCYGRGKTVQSMMEDIHLQNIGIDLPKQMLRQIWALLNGNQQHILRTLAELERPETVAVIEEITDLNFKNLNKALIRLKALCLIETKVKQDKEEVIDLHPLIRQFVRGEFAKQERESFIGKVLVYLDRRIFQFRSALNSPLPHLVLEMWIHKVDLLINSGSIPTAVDSLMEIETQLNNHGLNEEISRLAKRIFCTIDWLAAVSIYGNFDKLFNVSMRSVIEVEGPTEAEHWLVKYEQSIAGKGAQYINLCDIQAYKFWFVKDYDDAILWASRGESLKKSSNVDTVFQTEHTLALAQRDSGLLDEAFKYFRDGLSDEEIFSDSSTASRAGQFFGNLGRCYHLAESLDKAIAAYKVSASKLDNGDSSVVDQGYIRFWVGQAMLGKGRREDAFCFFKAAMAKWGRVAPTMMVEVSTEVSKLMERFPDLIFVAQSPEWKFENRFAQWINEK